MKRQTHDFEGQQQVREDDGGIDAKYFRGRDRDFGCQRRSLANLQQRMLLSHGAIFRHVTTGLPHEPHRSSVHRLPFAGANEGGIGGRHEPMNVAFLAGNLPPGPLSLRLLCETECTTVPMLMASGESEAGEIVKERVELTVPGSPPMAAYVARPSAPGRHPGLIVFQEAFGVNSHIRSVTERFAAQGYVAVAPELFHRTAPAGFEGDYNDFPFVMPHYRAVTNEAGEADVRAVYEWLGSQPEREGRPGLIPRVLHGRQNFVPRQLGGSPAVRGFVLRGRDCPNPARSHLPAARPDFADLGSIGQAHFGGASSGGYGYFVSTVGGAPRAVIKQYVEKQENVEAAQGVQIPHGADGTSV